MALRCALLMTVVTVGAMAVPFEYGDTRANCATSCQGSTTKFQWSVGKTYEYQYESEVKTLIAGAMEDHSSLQVRAKALIEVLAPCEMVLRLSDVTLEDWSQPQQGSRRKVERSAEFREALERRPLRFAFQDGSIESICPEQGEETWVLNVKRGIVSAFQNTQRRLDASIVTVETDIAGTCPVEYQVEGSSWGTNTIRKTKDLLGCTERMGHFTAFQSTPYNVDSAIQTMPVMKSTHECRQQISKGILIESTCTELHVFRPFSKGNSGAVTEVSYKISFQKERTGVSARRGVVSTMSSLIFEHEINREQMQANARDARQSVEMLCRQSMEGISVEVPRLFRRLVYQLRRVDSGTLQAIYRSASGTCEKAPKFIRDAIPVIGTSASLNLMRDLIMEGEVTEKEADTWISSLAFVASPTREMLAEVKPLLNQNRYLRKSALAISTMVHKYCRENGACASDPEVEDILRIFEENLRYNCKAQSNEQHDLILISLKAIGNIGRAARAAATINRCFRNQELPIEVRVAALQAMRRRSCEADLSDVKELLASDLEDSELRIQAYMILMKCPSQAILQYVQAVLVKEEVNQVGSFIWTHLTNLMETANPLKQDVRRILQDVELKRKFDLDKRKFSRNIEMSVFSKLINVGGMAEGNLIWSEKSFIPRAASLNMTVELFGESVNLVEIGVRAQGMEMMLEKLFAKQDNAVERRKRAADRIAMMDRQYNGRRDAPQASYYIRVFGNEISYDDLHDFDLETIKGKLNYLDWLMDLSKEHSFDLTKSMLFLDSSLVVPTATGLPLRLKIDGTSSVMVTVSGQVDVRQLFSSKSIFNIDGAVKPSGSMEINGEMGIDAHVAQTGIIMKTTLHSSMVAEGKIQMRNGKIFKMDIKAPADNTEIISAESKFFIINRGREIEPKMLDVKRIAKNVCTGSGFETVTGLQLCAQFSSPMTSNKMNMPWAIINGPASASLILNKKDTQTRYVLEANLIMEGDQIPGITPAATNIHFYADTPGSRTNRKILVDVTLDRENGRVSLDLNTPWKMAKFEGELINTGEMKRVMTSATLDGRDEYLLSAELGYDKRSYISQYTPKLEIRIPGRNKILLSGEMKHRPGKKSVFSVVLRNAFREPVKASGTIVAVNEPNQMRYETDLEFSSQMISGKVNAFVDSTEDEARSLSSKVEVEYALGTGPRQRMQFEQQIVDSSKYNTHSYSLVSSWSSTLAERYNGDIRMDFVMDSESLRTGIVGGFDQRRRITFIETATFKFGREQEINMDMSILLPYMDIDYTGKVEYLRNDNEFKVLGNTKLSGNTEASFTMLAKRNSRKPMNVMVEATMTYPGRDIAVTGSIEERAVGVYYQSLNIQLQKYENIIVNSVYKAGPRNELTADIIIPKFPKITIKGHLKPDLTDLQAGGEVVYGDRTYMTDVNLLRRGGGKSFSVEVTAEIAYPERRIMAQGTASRQGNEVVSNVELKWDARNDERKKFAMLAKINIEPSAPAADVQISVYPQNFVNLKMNGKYEQGGWYKSDTDVEGSFALQSSIPNLEDIGASFQHDRTPKGYRNSGEISWQKGKKVTGLLNMRKRGSWSNGQVDVEVSTPFAGARRMNTEIGYNIQDTRLSASAKAKLENKQMTLELNGQMNPRQHRLSGDIAFSSPYASLRSVTASVRHSDDGQKYESSLTTSWAPGKQISADFSMEHRGSISDATNNGKLLVATPFPGYEQAKISWQHAHNSNGMENAVQVEREGRPVYSHSAVANTKRTGSKFQADLQASMKASNMNEMSLTVDHSHDPEMLQTMSSACSFSWAPAKTILLSYDVDRSGDKLMWLSGRLQTPFRGFEDLAIKSNTNRNGNMALSSNEIKLGASRKITLEAEATIRGYEFEMRSHLTTPFAAAQNLAINVQNHRQDGIWKTRAEIDYGKRIELDMEMSGDAKKMISMHLTSPCPYLRDVYVKAEIEGVARNFIYSAEIRHDQLADKIKVNGRINMADIRNIQVTANVKTPFEAARYLKVIINENLGTDSIHLDAAIEHPSYKSRLTEDITYEVGTFINSKTVVEYMEGRAIEMEANFRIKPKMSAEIVLKSPFENYREIKLILSHELSLSGFSTTGELSYGPGDKINANVNYYKTGNTITGTVELTTPFQAIKRMALVVNHEGTMKAFHNDVKLELNDMQITGKSELTMDGGSLGLKMEVQTPIDGFESITVEMSHRGPITNFRNNLRLTVGTMEIVSTGQFKIGRSSMTGSLDVRLPFDALRSVGLIIDHSGSWTDFTDKFIVAYNSKKILIKSAVKLSGSSLNSKLTVKTPFEMLRSMAVVIRHEGPLDNFKNDIVITLNDKDLTADSQLLLSGNSMAATANVALPNHIGSLEVSHEGPMTNFRNSAILKYNGATCRGESQFAKRGDSVNGRLAYSYPSNAVSAEFNHRGMATNFNNDMTVMYGDKKMEGRSKFKWLGNAMTAEGSLDFPQNRWSVVASHEGPLDSFKNNFDLQLNRNSIKGNSEMRISGSNLALKASLNTPYDAMKSASVDISHSGPLVNFNNNAALRMNNKQYTGSSELMIRGDRLNAKAAFHAPETSLAGEVNHVGALTDFKNDARMVYNGKEMTGNGEFRWKGDQLSLAGRLNTPSNAISADFSHRGSWRNFNNNGALTMNGKTISAMSAFNRSGDDLNGELAFNMPSKRMAIEVAHRGPITNFVTDATLAYDRQRAGGRVQFKLDDDGMKGKAMLKLPSDGTPSVQLEVNHEGPMNNFRNDFNLKFGKRQISGSGQFKRRSNRLYAMGELNLPTDGIRHVVAELTHNGRRTNFENTLQMKINDDSIKADSSFALDDAGMRAGANIQTSYNLKPISIEIYHKGALRHFTEKAVVAYGENRLTATGEFRLEGDALSMQAKIEPSCCMEPIAIDLMFRGPLTSFTARASANYGRYEAMTSNEFSIRGNALHLKSVLRSNIANLKPILIELNHKGPMMDFTNDAMISYGGDKIIGTSEFRWQGSTIHLKSTIQTTIGGMKPISIEVIHSGPIDRFQDSILMSYGNEEIKAEIEASIEANKVMVEVELFTPFSQARTVAGKFTHNGKSWHNFENSGSLKVNNNRYTGQSEFRWFGKIFKLYAETKVPEEYSLKINHKGTMTDFSNNMKVKIPGERITGTSSLQALGNKVEGRVSLDSSMAGLSNMDASFSHEGEPRKFKTSFNLRTPFQRYDAFSGELSHEGMPDGFQTFGLLNLPFADLRRVQVNLNHLRSDNKQNTAGSVSYNGKTIAGEVKYEKTARKTIADATLRTPYSGYESFGASMEHAGAMDNFQTNGAITTSIPGYERFTGMLSHSGDSRGFTTNAEVTTPFEKYNKFGVSVEHRGNMSNFKTSGSLTTPIPGCEKLSGSLNHNGNLRAFTTNALFQTMIPGHEVYKMSVDHDTNSGIRTSASLEYPGNKYDFRLNHRGTAKDFTTDVQIQTPHRGYEQFGMSLAHSGDLNDMTQSGTIRLPMNTIPEIKYSVSHKGSPSDFSSSGWLEYGNARIEGNGKYRQTSSFGEDKYEGALAIRSTYAQLRDFEMKARHTSMPSQQTGTMDVSHNGQKAVDFDYDYATSGPTRIELKVRRPRPFETKLRFQNVGDQFNGDAFVNWDGKFDARGELNVKNMPNDRELNLKLVLPSRTVILRSGYENTGAGIKHSTDFQWGSGEGNKISYVLEGSMTNQRRRNVIAGRFALKSSALTGEATLNHVGVPDRQYTTEVALQTDKRMAIKSDLTLVHPRFQHDISLEHPDIPEGVTLKYGGLMDNKVYDGKIELQYKREVVTFLGRVADVSSPDSYKYESSCRLTHPGSNLDFQYSGVLINNADISSWSMATKYLLSKTQEYITSSLRAELDKTRNEAILEIINPFYVGSLKSLRISGRQTYANGVYRYDGEASIEQNMISAELTLANYKSADLIIHYSDNDYLQATAKMTSDQLRAEIFRMASGVKIQEALFSVQRDPERMLTSRMYWRPDMLSDIKSSLRTTSFGRRLNTELQNTFSVLMEDWQAKAEYARMNIQPLYRSVVAVKNMIVSAYINTMAELKSMYEKNEFHVRDIADLLVKMNRYVRSTYATLRRSAKNNYTSVNAVLTRSRRSIDDIMNQTWAYTDDLSTTISSWWSNLVDTVNSTARALVDKVSSLPDIMDSISETSYNPLRYLDQQDEAAATSGVAPSFWSQLLDRDDIRTSISYLKQQIMDSEIVNEYFEMKNAVQDMLADIQQRGLKTIRTNIVAWAKDYLKPDKDSIIIGDGEVKISLYIPLPLDDLRTIPSVEVDFAKYAKQARDMFNKFMPKYEWTFWDYYYTYKPSGNIRDMIPPFSAHATIGGNQHYMTFDKKFYEFAGDCSYLLARDFIDGTFSVIVNYERMDGDRPTRKSLTLISNDKTVVISTDGTVMMDNARVELPLQLDGISVLREANQIRVANKNGVTITCDLAHNQCTVEVSGWYYGKTAGLMGTYNNEMVDDFTTVDKERVNSAGQLAASWSLGARCKPVNYATEAGNAVVTEPQGYGICAEYFIEESSPFRRCFRIVKPEPFMKMCLSDMLLKVNGGETETDVCDAAAFYISECQRAGVPIKIPSVCVRCEMINGQMFSEGQNVTIREAEIPNSADFVFVIHESECNGKMLANLKNVVDSLENVLAADRLTNNRYAIVGYGGPGITADAHIHTIDGQVFAPASRFSLGLATVYPTAGDAEDAMAAIKYATNLPFRVGVSKNIILMPCAPCRQGQATFSELQQLLLFKDISFHVLMQYNFQFKTKRTTDNNFIFGIDRETVYTRKDAGTTEIVGDSEIRSQITVPKDLCVALSEETSGSVFNTLQYTDSRPYIQKRFLDVLVRVISEKAEPSDCQICECKPDIVGAGKADCRHCVRPNPIYEILPSFEDYPLPPSSFQMLQVSGLSSGKTSKTVPTKSKVSKSKAPKSKVSKSKVSKSKVSKATKSKKPGKVTKRTLRQMRLERLEGQQDM